MWILTPLQTGGETHYLLTSKEYLVGRKNCDILLPHDQSISRVHAHLTATDQTLILKDTSKYGIFVNSQRVTGNVSVNLKSGDIVTFGVFHSKFTVNHQKLVVCSSCLDSDCKASLSQTLLALGGKLVNTWTEDCTHLTMPSVKVTVKTISALLCCCPIVKPEFFSELDKAVQQKLPPPKAESFVPEIDEPSLSKEDINLRAMPIRKQLFTEKTFVFLSAKQNSYESYMDENLRLQMMPDAERLKRLSVAVGFGGGRSQLLKEGSLPHDLLESPHSCVIDVMTSSSQTLFSPSLTEWAISVKNIVQRKGFRVITESEIGLAAIFASCEKYCNPSNLIPDSESTSKAKPTVPSATLSQNMVVDETILPAASQNITAYAPNTEPFQGTELCEVTGVTRVEETPEKKQNQYNHQLHGFKPMNPLATQCNVAHTVSSSLSSAENTQGKKPESKQKGAGEGPSSIRSKAFTPKTNGGMKSFLQKQSPQKQKSYAQNSPQKQSTLTNFFQPINKKRPLEDEFSGVMSEPKRPVLESSINMQAPDSLVTAKEIYPVSYRVPAAALQTALGSDDDLFTGPIEAHRVPRTEQEEPRSRKRKEIEAEIEMEELESIMSEDMDCFDEQPLGSQAPQTQQIMQSSVKQKQSLNTVASLSKRQRVDRESGSNQRPQVGLEENSDSYKGQAQKSEYIVSTNKEQVPPSEYRTTNQEGSKSAEMLSAKTSKNRQPFEDDEASFTEDLELLKGDICQPKQETKTMIKQEAQESKINEDLPKNLLLVEFRSLTVAAPPKTKPMQIQNNDRAKNFKCFRKVRQQCTSHKRNTQ
uniref:Nibrin n=1 Tax=Mastacembelus armatus TaxID=205130 RepID=A0A3Q3MF21_9TELE